MSPARGHRAAPVDDRHRAVRQPLAPPPAASRASSTRGRRRPPDKRRRPRARPAPRRSCRAPARRPGTRGARRARSGRPPTGTAPARRPSADGDRLDRLGVVARERRTASAAARRSSSSRSSTSPAGWVTWTSWRPMNASSSSASHGSSGTARVPSAPGSWLNAVADVRIPHDLEPQLLAVDAAEPHQPRGRRRPTGLDDRQATLGGDVEPRRLLLADHLSDLGGQRHEQPAVVLHPEPGPARPAPGRRGSRAPTSPGRRGGWCVRGRSIGGLTLTATRAPRRR